MKPRIVVESTGGYERALVGELAEAGLPVAVVKATQARVRRHRSETPDGAQRHRQRRKRLESLEVLALITIAC
jgi:transposase